MFALGFGRVEEFGVFEQEQDQFRPHVRISGASARKMTETAKKHLDRNLFRRPTERDGYFQAQPGHRGVEEPRGLDLNLNTVATFDSHVGVFPTIVWSTERPLQLGASPASASAVHPARVGRARAAL